jgi:hypothetical protein
MRLRNLPLALTGLLASCVLFQHATPPLQQDLSIRFPELHAQAVKVGEPGQPYELDGPMLRALTIAANDFIPSDDRERQCWERQEAHSYRVVRQGEIIFVWISPEPAACQQQMLILDGGAKYAISTDGRILRRLFSGEPEASGPDAREAGGQEPQGTSVPTSQVGAASGELASDLPASWFDAGTPDAGSDAGTPDAG